MARGDLLDDTKFPGFNLPPKHNWLHNVSGKPVISVWLL